MQGSVDLYHDLQGGRIAELRPPPPGSTDPYPDLHSVPARPPASDIVAQQRIADRLAAQRDATEIAAARDPILAIAPPPKPPAAPFADPNGNRMVVDAAPAPAPAPPPARVAAPAIPKVADVAAPSAAIVSGTLPGFAAAPPPPAQGYGNFVQPPAATPAPDTAPTPVPNGVAVAFTPGSATLPPSAPVSLGKFALGHRGVPLSVTGRGEAVLHNADAQGRGLDLALRRAQAIATSLSRAGIPASLLRLHAEAAGTGGTATLN